MTRFTRSLIAFAYDIWWYWPRGCGYAVQKSLQQWGK